MPLINICVICATVWIIVIILPDFSEAKEITSDKRSSKHLKPGPDKLEIKEAKRGEVVIKQVKCIDQNCKTVPKDKTKERRKRRRGRKRPRRKLENRQYKTYHFLNNKLSDQPSLENDSSIASHHASSKRKHPMHSKRRNKVEDHKDMIIDPDHAHVSLDDRIPSDHALINLDDMMTSDHAPISSDDMMTSDYSTGNKSDQSLATSDDKNDQDDPGYGIANQYLIPHRPPQADKLERILHPNIKISTQYLLTSMDRAMMSLKAGIEQVYEGHYRDYNITRYNIMVGLRSQLSDISQANNILSGVAHAMTRLTKGIYMRAHRQGHTRPTVRPKTDPQLLLPFPDTLTLSHDDMLRKVETEQGIATEKLRHTRESFDDCQTQAADMKKLRGQMSRTNNKRVLRDLMRRSRRVVQSVQLELPSVLAFKKMKRIKKTGGYAMYRDLKEANSSVYDARDFLRDCVENSKKIQSLYKIWKSRRRVSTSTKRRRRRRSVAERVLLRPILDKANEHARKLDKESTRIDRLFPQLLQQANMTIIKNEKSPSPSRMLHLVFKLQNDTQEIKDMMGRIRIAINATEERRCEYGDEMGSGEAEGPTPSDCDDEITEGSASAAPTNSSSLDENDFIFDGEDMLAVKNSPYQRLGEKLTIFITALHLNVLKTLNISKSVANKTKEFSSRWDVANSNLDIIDGYVTNATDFMNEWVTEQPKMNKTTERITLLSKSILELVNTTHAVNNRSVEKSEMWQKLKKVADSKKEETLNGQEKSSTTDDVDDEKCNTTEVENAVKRTQDTVQKVVSLIQKQENMVQDFEERFSSIRKNIAKLRSMVANTQRVLSTLQVTVEKNHDGFYTVQLPTSTAKVLHSSTEICIRTNVSEGRVLTLETDSHYTVLSLESSVAHIRFYDKGGYKKDVVKSSITLKMDHWYNIRIDRHQRNISLNIKELASNITDFKTASIGILKFAERSPSVAYVGGTPYYPMELGKSDWKGCIGNLLVDGLAVGLLQNYSDVGIPKPCTSFCPHFSNSYSAVFGGNGYVHYNVDSQERLRSFYVEVRTRQTNTSVADVTKRDLALHMQLKNGYILIETVVRRRGYTFTTRHDNYNDGQFHSIQVTFDNIPMVTIDDATVEGMSSSRTLQLTLDAPEDSILLGGALPSNDSSQTLQFLIGCTRQLKINGVLLTSLEVNSSAGVHTGRCTDAFNPWLSCVGFSNNSLPIVYGTTEDAQTIIIVAHRNSRGVLLDIQKGDEFNATLTLSEDGIKLTASKKEITIPFQPEDEEFVIITIKDTEDSELLVTYLEEDKSITYHEAAGWWSGDDYEWVPGPYTVAIGGHQDTSSQYNGGVTQVMIGEKVLDLTKYLTDNSLDSCSSLQTIRQR